MTMQPPPPPPTAPTAPQPPGTTVPSPALAGVGLRFVAVLIDGILLMALGWVLAALVGGATTEGFELTGLPALAWMVASVAYYIATEARLGATVGKLAVGLRVTLENGGRLDWRASVIRNLLRIVDGFAFYLVGAILVWTSPRRQRLGDRVAGTIVVRRSTAP
jgi:uncharacterized RDD family membrane protein YckC